MSETPGRPTPMPDIDLAGIRRVLDRTGIGNPLPTFVVGAAAYLLALIVSVIVEVSALIAMALGASSELEPNAPSDVTGTGDAFDGIDTLIRLPFQLLAMATFGSWGGTAQIPMAGTMHVSMRFLPLVITGVLVATCWFGGRWVQRRWGGGVLGIWLSALISGFWVAIVIVLGALILAEKIPPELGIGVARFHAAGFDTFFGAWMLTTLALALGRHSGRPEPAWWPLVSDLTANVRLAVVHALSFGAVMTVLGLLVLTVRGFVAGSVMDGPTALFAVPLVGGTVLVYAVGMSSLSSTRISATGDALGFADSLQDGGSIFSMPWYVWLVTPVLGLIGIVLASLVWQYRRPRTPGNLLALVVSWVALPLAYFGGGIVLVILGYAGYDLGAGGLLNMRASVHLALWTPLLTLLVGIVIELLARFGAPFVTPWIPSVLLRWFRRSEPGDPDTAGRRAAPDGYGTVNAPAAPYGYGPSSAPEPPHGYGGPNGPGPMNGPPLSR